MAGRVRILHLTDLHLRWHMEGSAKKTDRLSREMPAVLDRLAEMVGSLDVDAAVISGDLLDVPDEYIDGSLEDDQERVDMADRAVADYRLFRERAESLGLPMVIIPGNHDDDDLFDQVFADWRAVQDIAGLRFVCFRDGLASDRSPVRGEASRALFEEMLQDRESPPQVHVQHYMIDPPTFANGWKYEYVGAAFYRDQINRSGRVAAVLSGHYHPGSLLVSEEGVHYSVPEAFTSAPHPFRIVEIDSTAGRVVGIEHRSVDNG